MKYVDEIYPFGINTTIGPTGTIKRLYRNHDYFISRDYDMSIFALQTISHTKKTLSILKGLPENESISESVKNNVQKKGWFDLFIAQKHAFIVSCYLTSKLSRRHALRNNLAYIKDYINLGRTPDIVVFHEMDSCFHYLKNRKENTAKVVMFLHADGSDGDMFAKRFPKLEGRKEYHQLLENLFYCYKHCDCIAWISRLAKERFCNNHPEYANKTATVVNGIDDIQLPVVQLSTDFKYRLVSTGTVCERKGQYIIIEAMHNMRPDVLKETHLTIIGTGPDYSRLISMTEQYGLTDHISFTGNVPNNEVPQYLAKENIYVLMSDNEGLPISIIEAMRSGLPVISTKVAGIPEEVDERNGLLIDPDINQLTNVLNHLPEYEWDILGESSRNRFEKEFKFEIMRCHYADMFDSLYDK